LTKLPVSVLILTKNEERDLPGCIESVAWSDDVHLYDSHSTDRTVEIARAEGLTVTQRPFDNWAAHQNWGLRNLPFKNPWVFYIDADERVTPDLVEAIRRAVESPGDKVAFRLQRRDFFMGTWLRHVQATPWYTRLFRPEHVAYERLVNPLTVVDGPIGDVEGYLDHFPFSKGVGAWFRRHNDYSQLEAQQIADNRKAGGTFSLAKAFAAKDFAERRFHQKELFYRLPARPTIKFLVLYVLKGGFLDGKAGYAYSRMAAIYEYMIVLKTKEIERGGKS
jgi:glycosyltransferase involved in cell wall biosynthesis